MPRYTVKVGHYLILETIFAIEAPDRIQARQIAENMKDRGSFGAIAWEVQDANIPQGWTAISESVEIETVQEE
jgi:hypothetical protein